MTQIMPPLQALLPSPQMQHPPRQRLSSNGVIGNFKHRTCRNPDIAGSLMGRLLPRN